MSNKEEEFIQVSGVVKEAVRGAFIVQLDNSDHIVTCRLAGKMRKSFIRVVAGDHSLAGEIHGPGRVGRQPSSAIIFDAPDSAAEILIAGDTAARYRERAGVIDAAAVQYGFVIRDLAAGRHADRTGTADILSDHRQVDHRIELLDQVRQDDRHRKDH